MMSLYVLIRDPSHFHISAEHLQDFGSAEAVAQSLWASLYLANSYRTRIIVDLYTIQAAFCTASLRDLHNLLLHSQHFDRDSKYY